MVCDVLDFRCIFVNELIGDATLTVLIVVALYFIVASKMNFGSVTTIALGLPIALIFGLAINGFTAIMAFSTILIGVMLAYTFNKVIGNR